jgi:hypothetical protein
MPEVYGVHGLVPKKVPFNRDDKEMAKKPRRHEKGMKKV